MSSDDIRPHIHLDTDTESDIDVDLARAIQLSLEEESTYGVQRQQLQQHCQQGGANVAIATSEERLVPLPRLLAAVAPVRHVLHAFLTDADAARLWRVGRTATRALLTGFTFSDHVFAVAQRNGSDSDCDSDSEYHPLFQLLQLFERWQVRIRRLRVEVAPECPLMDFATGQSLLPPSLVALSWGSVDGSQGADDFLAMPIDMEQLWARESWEEQHWLRPNGADWTPRWEVGYGSLSRFTLGGRALRVLDARELPPSLRVLQVSAEHDQANWPLGSPLPPALTALQYGHLLDHDLGGSEGNALPNTLTYLDLGSLSLGPDTRLPVLLRTLVGVKGPLLPGMLPVNLRCLQVAVSFRYPLTPGVLPNSLRYLNLDCHRPQALGLGSLNEGLQYLDLGSAYHHPLPVGVLPTSLQVLCMGEYQYELVPGVIPEGVVAVKLSNHFGPLILSTFPCTLRWLQLYVRQTCSVATDVLPEGLQWLLVQQSCWLGRRLSGGRCGGLQGRLRVPFHTSIVVKEDDEDEEKGRRVCVDPDLNSELDVAIHISLQENRVRLARVVAGVAAAREEAPENAGSLPGTAACAAVAVADTEDALLQQAIAISMPEYHTGHTDEKKEEDKQ